jgi:hypothetical protein
MSLIKKCVQPGCEAIFHNCPKKQTKCKDCNGSMIIINRDTYFKKYYTWFWQYDFNTMEFYRILNKQQLNLNL